MITYFHNTLNESNKISEITSEMLKNPSTPKFFIGRGNNDVIVRTLMNRRTWWS